MLKWIVFLLIAPFSFAQGEQDSILSTQFKADFEDMLSHLQLSDSVSQQFHIIYDEYGALMKEAYENRTSWAALGHTYEWAVRDRDTKMKAILTADQLYYFKKRQREIEEAARRRKKELERERNEAESTPRD